MTACSIIVTAAVIMLWAMTLGFRPDDRYLMMLAIVQTGIGIAMVAGGTIGIIQQKYSTTLKQLNFLNQRLVV